MTATDPRPELAAKLAAGLAPAAEALALAYAEDMSAGPPPPDDRALAERHRAGRAQLAHLRQLLAVLDWAAAHLPEPEPAPVEEPADEFDNPFGEPDPDGPDHDGSEDRPGFREWSEDYGAPVRTAECPTWTTMTAAGTKSITATANMSAGSARPNTGREFRKAVAAAKSGRKPPPCISKAWPTSRKPQTRKAVRKVAMTKHDIP